MIGVNYALNVGAFYLAAQQVAFCKCLPLPILELLPHEIPHLQIEKTLGHLEKIRLARVAVTCL